MDLSRSSHRFKRLARGNALATVRPFPSVRLREAAPDSPALLPADRQFDTWRTVLREAVLDQLATFVSERCVEELWDSRVDVTGEILMKFVSGGKCLRSTFMYLGWLCGAPANDAALSATASLELLHAFALLQDDVMDESDSRRGRPAAHIQFADWHRARGFSGSSSRFGESAAILLGDLCLIWAEQMLRDSGLPDHHLQRAWPRYDAMRTELAVGQFADLAIDVRNPPTMESVLKVARLKSGNYTVRRPLEIGAAMAGCDVDTLARLSEYGTAVGEAFQLRDDILGVFGSPAQTGKPSGGDLVEQKATSVVVAAYQLADEPIRKQLRELMHRDHIDKAAVELWRKLILDTGGVLWIEEMISDRMDLARKALDNSGIDDTVCAGLLDMADACTQRAA